MENSNEAVEELAREAYKGLSLVIKYTLVRFACGSMYPIRGMYPMCPNYKTELIVYRN